MAQLHQNLVKPKVSFTLLTISIGCALTPWLTVEPQGEALTTTTSTTAVAGCGRRLIFSLVVKPLIEQNTYLCYEHRNAFYFSPVFNDNLRFYVSLHINFIVCPSCDLSASHKDFMEDLQFVGQERNTHHTGHIMDATSERWMCCVFRIWYVYAFIIRNIHFQ